MQLLWPRGYGLAPSSCAPSAKLGSVLRACLVELHLILILYGSWFSERSDSVAESDSLWFSSIKLLKSGWRITSQNQEKLLFSAPSLLVHFIESLHRISRESLLSKKLFGRAPAGFIKESALGALPNAPLYWPHRSALVMVFEYLPDDDHLSQITIIFF